MLRALLPLILVFATQATRREPYEAKVVHVSDGDTITVLKADKTQVKIRLHGVDAPETGQAFGAKAKERTTELAAGKSVKVLPQDTDRYGRTVAEVVLPDGRPLGRELVREGLAWHYSAYAPHDELVARLQGEAKAAKRGLWADVDPVAPWEYRRRARAGRGTRARTGLSSRHRTISLTPPDGPAILACVGWYWPGRGEIGVARDA